MIPRKKPSKNHKIVLNTCVSLIKQHCNKITETPEKHDFLTWSIQNFVKKRKKRNSLLENIILFY